jgi:hypothetical protein
MPVSRLKEKVLEAVGDQGADMIANVWSQIEYTAYWCIRSLHDGEEIKSVAPETGDDVVVERSGLRELRQVKTREESRGPWTTGEVLEVLCGQYWRRRLYPDPWRFCFVSDAPASPIGDIGPRSYGSLHRLKTLLDEHRERPPLSSLDQEDLQRYVRRLAPEIAKRLRAAGETCDAALATTLLLSTVIETNTTWLRQPEDKNLVELHEGLCACLPGIPALRLDELRSTYERLLLLIVKRILRGRSVSGRQIARDAVLDCRVEPRDVNDIDFSSFPGRTMLEKKLLYGGFHTSELPAIGKQKALSETQARELRALGLGGPLEQLADARVDRHSIERRRRASEPELRSPGPTLLERIRPHLAPMTRRFLKPAPPNAEQLGLGMLWVRTSECYARWDLDGLHSPSADDSAGDS